MSTIDCSSLCGLDGNWTSSNVKVHNVTYIWAIENFDFCEAKGDDLYSPVFSAPTNDNLKWIIQLKPNGETDSKDTLHLYLCLSNKSEHKTAFARCCFSIFNNKHEREVTRTFEVVRKFVVGIPGWGWPKFCTKDKNFRENVLMNKVLKISCEVTFSQEDDVVLQHHHHLNTFSPNSATSDCGIVEDLDTLFKTQLMSDVVISAKNKDFPAHKLILAARSKVFAAMFQHDTKENRLNLIEIEDMSEEVVGEMLRFIYVGRCEKLNELVEGLLAASDKYDLHKLKIICSKALCANLKIENAAKFLLLADMHNANELKTGVINFLIAAKSIEVFSTADWKNVLMNPQLTDEVCRALVSGRQ